MNEPDEKADVFVMFLFDCYKTTKTISRLMYCKYQEDIRVKMWYQQDITNTSDRYHVPNVISLMSWWCHQMSQRWHQNKRAAWAWYIADILIISSSIYQSTWYHVHHLDVLYPTSHVIFADQSQSRHKNLKTTQIWQSFEDFPKSFCNVTQSLWRNVLCNLTQSQHKIFG